MDFLEKKEFIESSIGCYNDPSVESLQDFILFGFEKMSAYCSKKYGTEASIAIYSLSASQIVAGILKGKSLDDQKKIVNYISNLALEIVNKDVK